MTQRESVRLLLDRYQQTDAMFDEILQSRPVKQIANLTDERRWILQFRSVPCQKYYLQK